MPTSKQDRDFNELMEEEAEVTIQSNSLDRAIDYISNNLEPQDVFTETQLKDWAGANGYVLDSENK